MRRLAFTLTFVLLAVVAGMTTQQVLAQGEDMRRQVFIACGFASEGNVGYDYRECTAFARDYLDAGGHHLDDAVNA